MSTINTTFFGHPVSEAFVEIVRETYAAEGEDPSRIPDIFKKAQATCSLSTFEEAYLKDRLASYYYIKLDSTSSHEQHSYIIDKFIAEPNRQLAALYSLSTCEMRLLYYFILHDKKNRLEQFRSSLSLTNDVLPETGTTIFNGRHFYLLGCLKSYEGNTEEGLEYLNKAQEVFNALNVPYLEATTVLTAIKILSVKNRNMCLEYYDKNLELFANFPMIRLSVYHEIKRVIQLRLISPNNFVTMESDKLFLKDLELDFSKINTHVQKILSDLK